MRAFLLSCLPNVMVLGSLGGIAFYGHETDWTFLPHKFGAHQAHGAGHADHGPSVTAVSHDSHGSPASGADVIQVHDHDGAERGMVESSPVVERPMEEFVSAPGALTYVRNGVASLSARVPGTVWRVEKRLGDEVRQGEILAILDASAVGDAKAKFLESLVDAELKELTVRRLKEAGNAVAGRQLAEAESALRQSLVTRFNSQQSLVNLGFSCCVDSFRDLSDAERSRQIHLLGIPESIARNLDRSSTSANLIPVVAPFDGVVIKCDIVRGEVVSPERSELAIANVGKMLLRLNVNKEDAMRVAVGQPIEYIADGVPGALTCQVNWISTELDDKTRTLQALAEVENPLVDAEGDGISHRLLKANTYGVGRIRVRSKPAALAVPAMAVQWDGSRHVVFVEQADGDETSHDRVVHFQQRVVVPGTVDDGFVEIIRGLEPGERVAVDGSHMLKSEMATRKLTSASN